MIVGYRLEITRRARCMPRAFLHAVADVALMADPNYTTHSPAAAAAAGHCASSVTMVTTYAHPQRISGL